MSTINFIIESLSKDGKELTEEEIKSIIESNGYKWGDIQLSDYCYNRYNNGEKFPKVFEYISRGKYTYLGENYPYTGEIYWKPRGQNEKIIGKWINGKREIDDKKIGETVMFIEIKIGEFVKNHLEKIVEYCENNIDEINNLLNREYSRNTLGIEANYSFLTLSNEARQARYWNTIYFINGNEYKFCSQLGGRNPIQNGLTRSQREGKKFLEYLKNKNILLDEYKDIEINFIVGKDKEPSQILPSSYNTKNIILYGVPGVGKTHNINKLINLIEKNEDSEQEIFKKITQNSETNEELDDENLKSRVVFTTFHQSFAYEDFIEGFRPNESGQIILRDGIFKIICENATNDKYNNYYLVIDEINRGNISKIFGELITLIEESKRDKLEILLPYSQEKFTVPSNLFIIGTMNSTDKSIALIDIALRRRFTFLELEPKADLIKNSEAKEFFIKLNEQLEDDYKIGHSYFMGENIDLDFVKEYKIKPLLKEYFYGNSEKLNEVLKIIEVGK